MEKNEAARRHRQADEFANSGGSLRTCHHWRKTARQATTAETDATRRYDELATPIQQALETDLTRAEILLGHLEGRASDRSQWLDQHPELERRVVAIEHELDPTPTIQERLRAREVESPSLGLEL